MNKQLFSTKVASHTRDYFFDVKQSQSGNYYLAINESRKSDDGNSKRQCVLVFNNLLTDFAAAFALSMQKISELDSSIIWNPRHSSHKNENQMTSNNDTTKRSRRYRDLTHTEIEHAQKVNLSNGKPKNFGLRWSENDRDNVRKFFQQGESVANIAVNLQRSIPSITAELMKQGLLSERSNTEQKPF